jgi:hypothetical protein
MNVIGLGIVVFLIWAIALYLNNYSKTKAAPNTRMTDRFRNTEMSSKNKFIDALKEAPVSFLIGGLMVISFVYLMMTHFGHSKREIEDMKQIRRNCWSRESARYGFAPLEDIPEDPGLRIAAQCEREVRKYLGIRE